MIPEIICPYTKCKPDQLCKEVCEH